MLVLSPNAIKSEWVKHELLFALNDKRYRKRIVPVKLKGCDASQLSWTLKAFQMLDFTSQFDDGCRELLKIWGVGFQPSPSRRPLKSAPRRKR